VNVFAHKTVEMLLIVMSEKCNGMLQYDIRKYLASAGNRTLIPQ
jgi:hypothetical protein